MGRKAMYYIGGFQLAFSMGIILHYQCTSTDTSLNLMIVNILLLIIVNNSKIILNNIKKYLIAYFKNMRTSNLIMQNNPHAQSKLKSSNVIYRFSCPHIYIYIYIYSYMFSVSKMADILNSDNLFTKLLISKSISVAPIQGFFFLLSKILRTDFLFCCGTENVFLLVTFRALRCNSNAIQL